ncbi:MAG: hypothetical protein ACW987_02780 [Candidatus Thorarchaeota archaeon]
MKSLEDIIVNYWGEISLRYYRTAKAKSIWTIIILIIFLMTFSIQGFAFTSDAYSESFSYDAPLNSMQVPRHSHLETSSTPLFENSTLPNLCLESMLTKYTQTNWNEMTNENNDTISWPEPIAVEPRVQPIREDMNSDLNSTKQGSSQSRTMTEGTGTTLFDDDCSSTVGWIPLSSWGGEPLLSEIQDGIDLLVDDGRFKSDDIPSSGTYIHGPMFINNLTYPAAVGEGLNLEVRLEHEDVDQKMGNVGVAIYDMYGDIIFRIWINDAWYGPRSDVWVAYYFLDWQGGGYQSRSVQMDDSWSSTIKIWYEKESDSIKVTIPGYTGTLVSDPAEEELARFVKTVAIYFGRYLDLNFKSSFIDSIYMDVDTDPTTGVPATPLTPAMDGHWFPKAGYSRLYFEVNQPYTDWFFYLRIGVEADQDTIDRFFTVRVDGLTVYDEVITNEDGFDGVVPVPLPGGIYKVELQIWWGGYVEKGWKLTYFYPERDNGEPLEVVSEYFPQASTARLTYLAQLGEDTKISIKVEADQDPIGRFTRVYVDGQFKQEGARDNAWIWSLGDYADDSLHEVTIELYWGGYAEWGKKLTINRVHHLGGSVEVDYMAGHEPPQDDLDVLEAYYINMGYHRAEFHKNDSIPLVYDFDLVDDNGYLSQQYWDYSNDYRDHAFDWQWEWMLWVHYCSDIGTAGHIRPYYGIIIADQVLLDEAWWPWTPPISAYRRSIALHEYGHHINIIDRHPDNRERYCINNYCAMALGLLNIVYYPWYCKHHWSLHRFPGW